MGKKTKHVHFVPPNRKSTKDLKQINFPHEVLVKIFSYYLTSGSHGELLNILSRVSLPWKWAALDSSLWRNVDNTLSIKDLLYLCKNDFLKYATNIDLSRLKSVLTTNNVTAFLKNCPKLEVVDLSDTEKISHDIIKLLPTCCSSITHINLSNFASGKKLNLKHLENLLTLCGKQLVHMNLSNNRIINFTQFFLKLGESCPNLKELIVMNLDIDRNNAFPIEEFQSFCPKLETLRMGPGIYFKSKQRKEDNSPGFPNLEVFTCVTDSSDTMNPPTSEELLRILKNSTKLNLLDLRGCLNITAEALEDLEATDLEHLFLSKSSICYTSTWFQPRYYDMNFLLKWIHSLKQLDLSRSHTCCLQSAIEHLIRDGLNSKLEELNISNTSICIFNLKKILDLPKLEILHLESCHSLIRGIKRVHRGKAEITALKERLCREGY